MPIHLEYDPEHNLLHRALIGPVTMEEVLNSIRTARREYPGDDSTASITDVSAAEQRFSIRDIAWLLEQIATLAADVPRVNAAVVAPTDDAYGMCRYLQIRASLRGIPIGVFRTHEEAREWVSFLRESTREPCSSLPGAGARPAGGTIPPNTAPPLSTPLRHPATDASDHDFPRPEAQKTVSPMNPR